MFIILMSEDSTFVDSVTVDSLTIDSIMVYEIPEIINFHLCDTAVSNKIFCFTRDITLTGHDQGLCDVLSIIPFTFHIYGIGQFNTIAQRGQNPEHTTVYLNGHRLDNPLFNYFNIVTLPVQFFESMSTSGEVMTSSPHSINIISKVNHYDRPFSYVNYTFGDFGNSIYNIDFTRPITNDIGFYLSGLYRDYEGYRENDDFQISSFYTNLYYNQLFPMRLDLIYFLNDYGLPNSPLDTLYGRGEDTFIDACFVGGANNHKIALYHTVNKSDYSEPYASTSSVKNYGFHTRNYHAIDNFILSHGIMGQRSTIDSDFFGTHVVNSLVFWVQLDRSFKKFFLSVASRGEWISTYDFFYLPRVAVGVDIYDSTYVTGAVSKSFRAPSLSETSESDGISYPYYGIRGNRDLLPEYYWIQEIGIKRKNIFAINLYKYDFTNRIVTQLDDESYYISENTASWQTIGVDGYLELPIYFKSHSNGNSMTEISIGYGGNYLFKGDSLPLVPKGMSSSFLSLKRVTERFSFSLLAKERFIGVRQDISGHTLNSFRVFSVAGTVKFISLSCTLIIDNIFNESYAYIPNYPMPPRSFGLSIKWEFWD